MAVLGLVNQLVRLLYRLTVGLTVLLIRTAIFYAASLAIVGLLAAVTVIATYKTYQNTHHAGLASGACALALILCWVAVFVLHRLARDVFKLTSLSLPQFIMLMLGRRPKSSKADSAKSDNAVIPKQEPAATERGDNAGTLGVERSRRSVITNIPEADRRAEQTDNGDTTRHRQTGLHDGTPTAT